MLFAVVRRFTDTFHERAVLLRESSLNTGISRQIDFHYYTDLSLCQKLITLLLWSSSVEQSWRHFSPRYQAVRDDFLFHVPDIHRT